MNNTNPFLSCSFSCFSLSDIVHRDLKLENILVKSCHHGNDNDMVNIKVSETVKTSAQACGMAFKRGGTSGHSRLLFGSPTILLAQTF